MGNKHLLYLGVVALLSASCKPGKLIDKELSESYFISPFGTIYYSPYGNWFEIGITRCDADNPSFKVVSATIARDKARIYYCGIAQPQVDYSSFYIDKGIPKDKNYAYTDGFRHLEPLKGVDAFSFEYLPVDTVNHTWSRDKNHYYIEHKKVKVDYASFQFLNQRFSKDKDSLYADMKGGDFVSVPANPATIVVVNDEYVRDENNLYYVSTFLQVELLVIPFQSFDKIRIIDRDVICVNDKVIYYGKVFKSPVVDAGSFQLYHPNTISSYAKDTNHVYYREEVIDGANPATYQPLELGYGKDDKQVYFGTNVVQGADPKSFRYENSRWKDDRHQYQEGQQL